MAETLVKIQNLVKTFPVKAGPFSNTTLTLKAVDGVNLEVKKGETLGLVGESGCGKTTVGRCILRLYDPDSGYVWIEPNDESVSRISELDRRRSELAEEMDKLRAEGGMFANPHSARLREIKSDLKDIDIERNGLRQKSDLLAMKASDLKQNRRRVQMVFQDPWASLNPTMVVKDIIGEGPREFGTHRGPGLEKWVMELLDKVGLPKAAANRYPHEFSGGQRQRIGIARALSLTPSLIVCDEPVSALDVSIQAQILNLLLSLQDDFDLTFIFIAHDLSVVEYISDRIAVMYLGKIVELGTSNQVAQNPRHPYTISLLSSVPVADPDHESEEIILEGDVPSPVNPPPGCTFHPRCPHKIDVCTKVVPQLEKDQDGHVIACHNPPKG